jgi:hypothetical protein
MVPSRNLPEDTQGNHDNLHMTARLGEYIGTVASGHWWDITKSIFIAGFGTAEREALSFAIQQPCRPLYGGLTCDQNIVRIQDIPILFLWNGRL